LISARMAGMSLKSISLRVEGDEAQTLWVAGKNPNQPAPTDGLEQTLSSEKIHTTGIASAQKLLMKRGEPARYMQLYSAAIQSILSEPVAADIVSFAPADVYGYLNNILQKMFTHKNGFLRFGGSEHSVETGYFWLGEDQNSSMPLTDRVEIEVVHLLQAQPGITENELDQEICAKFPGMETPERSAVHACLDSYGEQDPPESSYWRLRAQDSPAVRRDDLAMMQKLIVQLGQRAGYRVSGDTEPYPAGQFILEWRESSGKTRLGFYVIASALLSKVLARRLPFEHQAVIICPGGRAGLIDYKRKTNPYLVLQIENKWLFVKFRHIRRLAENSRVDPAIILDQLLLDPLSNQDPQMQLL